MLQYLHVKNLALIDESEVDFQTGLNILTGETGAGKSIIIGSINLALGEKASKGMIREGSDYCLVELVFTTSSNAQISALQDLDIFPEDGQVILSRKIMANGRSVCKINSETVSAALMRKVASLLIDIHGQHEGQSLLTKKNHMKYLDAFAGKELEGPFRRLKEQFGIYEQLKSELEQVSLDSEGQARELSFLEYEVTEILDANLIEGEDEELETEFKRLTNGQKILSALASAKEFCSEGRENAADAIGRSSHELLSVSAYDEELNGLSDQLQEIESLLSDFNHDLDNYLDSFDYSEERFAQIEERLDTINHLKSKYGNTISLILQSLREKEERIEKLQNLDTYREELNQRLSQAQKALKDSSVEVSAIRKKNAVQLTEKTKQALVDLNFLDVRFEMEFSELDHFTDHGTDEARFMISTNPGEPLKPLDNVASGGELSRIMLALKTVLAEEDDIETLIFDEIDSGISGRTAQMVAEKMKSTAKIHQVICITHLPQIAAMADAHFLIEKTSSGDSTISDICRLNRDESIQELARMLGGVKITDTVLENAREMKEMAEGI